MPDTSDARNWDLDRSRLFGIIDRLHQTIDGLLAGNSELTQANRELVQANKELTRALSDIHRMSGPESAGTTTTLTNIHARSMPSDQEPPDELAA